MYYHSQAFKHTRARAAKVHEEAETRVLPKAVNSAHFYENWHIDVITNVGSAVEFAAYPQRLTIVQFESALIII